MPSWARCHWMTERRAPKVPVILESMRVRGPPLGACVCVCVCVCVGLHIGQMPDMDESATRLSQAAGGTNASVAKRPHQAASVINAHVIPMGAASSTRGPPKRASRTARRTDLVPCTPFVPPNGKSSGRGHIKQNMGQSAVLPKSCIPLHMGRPPPPLPPFALKCIQNRLVHRPNTCIRRGHGRPGLSMQPSSAPPSFQRERYSYILAISSGGFRQQAELSALSKRTEICPENVRRDSPQYTPHTLAAVVQFSTLGCFQFPGKFFITRIRHDVAANPTRAPRYFGGTGRGGGGEVRAHSPFPTSKAAVQSHEIGVGVAQGRGRGRSRGGGRS